MAQILQSPQGQQVNTEKIKTKHFRLLLINGKKAQWLCSSGCNNQDLCDVTQLQQLVQSLQLQQQKPQPSLLQALDAGLVVQLQALTAQLTAAATANSLNPLEQRVSSFNKVMLQPPIHSLCPFIQSLLMLLCCFSRNFWVLSILGMTPNAVTSRKRTPHHLSCELILCLM